MIRPLKRFLVVGAAVVALTGPAVVSSNPAAARAQTQAQAQPTVWLCRPGLAESPAPNPCEGSLATTVLRADGTETVKPAPRPGDRPVDCFYVYPTVSTQPTPNADLTIEPAEISVAHAQASRFSSACRVYAPMYRQLTLATISGGGTGTAQQRLIAYTDVANAWEEYLATYNDGRPVVLIGHSQGSAMLTALLRLQIEKDPEQLDLIVSALLPGTNIEVPVGRDVGGTFHDVPACRSRTQTGCVVSYASFDAQPPPDSRFGRPTTGGAALPSALKVLCVNPARPAGGTAPLDPFFPTDRLGASVDVTTPWVELPGLYTAACMQADGITWLQVNSAPTSPTDDRPRALVTSGPAWGLHRSDVNLPLGDLVALVRSQSRAFTKP
jgi:pimeloyl-ACP methyl ester carboxylesterase